MWKYGLILFGAYFAFKTISNKPGPKSPNLQGIYMGRLPNGKFLHKWG